MNYDRDWEEYERKMRQLDYPNEYIVFQPTERSIIAAKARREAERETNEKEREQAWGSWHKEKKILPLLSHYMDQHVLIKPIVFLSPPLALIVFVFISWGFIPAALLFLSFVFYIMR